MTKNTTDWEDTTKNTTDFSDITKNTTDFEGNRGVFDDTIKLNSSVVTLDSTTVDLTGNFDGGHYEDTNVNTDWTTV